jgi:uncharacterized protein YbjT (DUF2867 family)
MERTAVVFGSTGLVGSELVSQLLEDEAYSKVIALVRRSVSIPSLKYEQLIVPDFATINHYKNKLQATDYFCCIGTTIKTAGTKEAFRKVDFEIPVQIAQMASELSIANLVIISSVGANPYTNNFYLRTKGEMENAVKTIYKGNLKIVRPSFLIGDRKEYRFGEQVAKLSMKVVGRLFIGPLKKYKAIHVSKVAHAMIHATGMPGDKIFLESDELQD